MIFEIRHDVLQVFQWNKWYNVKAVFTSDADANSYIEDSEEELGVLLDKGNAAVVVAMADLGTD